MWTYKSEVSKSVWILKKNRNYPKERNGLFAKIFKKLHSFPFMQLFFIVIKINKQKPTQSAIMSSVWMRGCGLKNYIDWKLKCCISSITNLSPAFSISLYFTPNRMRFSNNWFYTHGVMFDHIMRARKKSFIEIKNKRTDMWEKMTKSTNGQATRTTKTIFNINRKWQCVLWWYYVWRYRFITIRIRIKKKSMNTFFSFKLNMKWLVDVLQY